MNNVLIDDRRIKVDFSQSVAKLWNRRRRGETMTAYTGSVERSWFFYEELVLDKPREREERDRSHRERSRSRSRHSHHRSSSRSHSYRSHRY